MLPTETEFNRWRDASGLFFEYLDLLKTAIRDQWAEGENWTEEARWQVQNYEDIQNLSFADMLAGLFEVGRLSEDDFKKNYPKEFNELFGED